MSLKNPHSKMSKSDKDPQSRILLSDTDQDIKTKINSALTDSQEGISYDVAKRPGVSNLLEILSSVQGDGAEPSQCAATVNGLSMRAFKELVANKIIEQVAPVRSLYFEMLAKKSLMEDVMGEGAERARERASTRLKTIYNIIGLR